MISDKYVCEPDISIVSQQASEIRSSLINKLREVLSKQGLRKPITESIFRRLTYISPENVRIINYLRSKPLAVFNPGAYLVGNKLWIFPRLVFDYYWYVSSIGFFEIDIEDLFNKDLYNKDKHVEAKIIIAPSESWEIYRGCEDPRIHIHNNIIYVLYTAVGLDLEGKMLIRQALATLDKDLRIQDKKCFAICHEGKRFRTNWKDSGIIKIRDNELYLATRPSIPIDERRVAEINWFGVVDKESGCFDPGRLKPVMSFEKSFEYKIGWSTNTLKISSNEYLVGWHGVGVDNIYRNGLAVISDEGDLLGVSNYLLEPERNLVEFYGDRPGVIFGNGLIEYKEYLLWIGGVSDYSIGIFISERNKALEKIKWLRG
jgi:predicted GH43/DUF377 family glycosyl hydrolase